VPPIPAAWRRRFALFPEGYDPIATAGEGEWFDARAADNVVAFFRTFMFHSKGPAGGKPMVLEPWQEAIVGALIGWKRASGTRRYRQAFIYIARKNGKTTLGAGLTCYFLFADKEHGAELYSCASEREQAAITFQVAKASIQQCPRLEAACTIHESMKSIRVASGGRVASYKALSAEAGTKHGLNASFVLMDELHTYRDRDLFDVMETSMGARAEPLMVSITTADEIRKSICNEQLDYAEAVAAGRIKDSAFLPVLYRAPRDADPWARETWAMANPNLGVSIFEDYLRQAAEKARASPARENSFRRLHCNQQVEAQNRWLSSDAWNACGGELPKGAKDGPCHVGVDLSSRTDLTAMVAYWPHSHAVEVLVWVPRVGAARRTAEDQIPYLAWEAEGIVRLTEGDCQDLAAIEEDVAEWCAEHDVASIGIDPMSARQMVASMQERGLPVFEFLQFRKYVSPACVELERLVIGKRLRHDDNPVLAWCVANCVVDVDRDGFMRPNRKQSKDKIDALMALLFAIGRSQGETEGPSVYETEGLLVL
jgi:phage terminase large subunit-like protein